MFQECWLPLMLEAEDSSRVPPLACGGCSPVAAASPFFFYFPLLWYPMRDLFLDRAMLQVCLLARVLAVPASRLPVLTLVLRKRARGNTNHTLPHHFDHSPVLDVDSCAAGLPAPPSPDAVIQQDAYASAPTSNPVAMPMQETPVSTPTASSPPPPSPPPPPPSPPPPTPPPPPPPPVVSSQSADEMSRLCVAKTYCSFAVAVAVAGKQLGTSYQLRRISPIYSVSNPMLACGPEWRLESRHATLPRSCMLCLRACKCTFVIACEKLFTNLQQS